MPPLYLMWVCNEELRADTNYPSKVRISYPHIFVLDKGHRNKLACVEKWANLANWCELDLVFLEKSNVGNEYELVVECFRIFSQSCKGRYVSWRLIVGTINVLLNHNTTLTPFFQSANSLSWVLPTTELIIKSSGANCYHFSFVQLKVELLLRKFGYQQNANRFFLVNFI